MSVNTSHILRGDGAAPAPDLLGMNPAPRRLRAEHRDFEAHEVREAVATAIVFASACEHWLQEDRPNLGEARHAIAGALEASERLARILGCSSGKTLSVKEDAPASAILS